MANSKKRNQNQTMAGKNNSQSSLATENYSSLRIEGFRSFENLELPDLGTINLLFGPNNSGKTSILEAVFAHAAGRNFAPFMGQIVLKRHGGSLGGALEFGEELTTLFYDRSRLPYKFTITAMLQKSQSPHKLTTTFHPSTDLSSLDPRNLGQAEASITSGSQDTQVQQLASPPDRPKVRIGDLSLDTIFLGKWNTTIDGRTNEFELYFPPSNLLAAPAFKQGHFHDLTSHREADAEIRLFSHLKRSGYLKDFTEKMHEAFPQFVSLDMIPYADGTAGPLYVETTNGERLPLYVFGDGMRRWFHLLGYMTINRNAIHCIEEIDATFHPDAHERLARLLLQYSKAFHNQLFLTSHSIEFADAFLNGLYGEQGTIRDQIDDPVRLYTIRSRQLTGRPEVWKFAGREAYEKRKKFALDLRG